MTPPDDPAAFPRRRLSLRWSRRQWLSSLATERRIEAARSSGASAHKLADLGTLPDEILELLRPELIGTLAPAPHGADGLCNDAALMVAGRFNGRATLGEVAGQLARDRGWAEPYAFAYVRGVFLQLVSTGLCLPK